MPKPQPLTIPMCNAVPAVKVRPGTEKACAGTQTEVKVGCSFSSSQLLGLNEGRKICSMVQHLLKLPFVKGRSFWVAESK